MKKRQGKTKQRIYEQYPLWMVLVVNIFQLAVYAAGAYILFELSMITGTLYVLYLLMLEVNVYREGCRYCCYYGKLCAFGKGKVAVMFFRRGNPKKFCERKLSFKDIIPQLLVVLIPVIVGIALIISRGFDWIILMAILYPLFSWLCLNPIIYGKLACAHCKQGSICCPALEFFMKKGKK